MMTQWRVGILRVILEPSQQEYITAVNYSLREFTPVGSMSNPIPSPLESQAA